MATITLEIPDELIPQIMQLGDRFPEWLMVNLPDAHRADQGEFRILYYIQESTDEQLGQVQIFRVGKRNDDEVYRNL